MIQIAYYNTSDLGISRELEASFELLADENAAKLCKGPLILGLDEINFESIKNIINSRNQQVVLAIKNKHNFKLIPELKNYYTKIFGFIDLTAEKEVAIPLLRNYISINFSKEALSLTKLSKQLEQIHERTQTELRGIKELHDRFVKMRTEKIKGAELLIKFMAGDRSGGEFFDYIARDSQMFFLQAGSDSYVMSSLIISAMEDFKVINEDFYSTIDAFIASLKHQAQENGAKLSYTIMIVKLKTMEASIYSQGNSKIFYANEIISPEQSCTIKLKRGDKIAFLSEGTFSNWNIHHQANEMKTFLANNLEMNNRDFINELFFELARNKKGTFLDYDALVAMLEINENVLHQL